ncbi:hypothetical protein NHG29_01870 [Aerococcaceae bacterium NML160702]|nr:hypothetical protein [Aerococcaceae bacterium NML160702]
MVLKIGKKVEAIEIDILGHVFKVTKSDEMLVKVDKVAKRLVEEAARVEGMTDIEQLQPLRQTCIEAFDTMLGDGAFEKVEKATSDDGGEYTLIMVGYFMQVFEHINNEFENSVDVSRYSKRGA